ncbi:hypothetical protein ABVT39_027308 [Epinephelus coioides]
MDPAETEHFKQALSSQGTLLGQHDATLGKVMEALQTLSTNVNQISSRMDNVATQLSTISFPVSTPPPPAPPVDPPASPPLQPREPFIPTPARYSVSTQSSDSHRLVQNTSFLFEVECVETQVFPHTRLQIRLENLQLVRLLFAVSHASFCFELALPAHAYDVTLRESEANRATLRLEVIKIHVYNVVVLKYNEQMLRNRYNRFLTL